MRILPLKFPYIVLILTLSCSSCADDSKQPQSSHIKSSGDIAEIHTEVAQTPEPSKNDNHYKSLLYSSGDILIFTSKGHKGIEGSLISIKDGDNEIKAQRIMTILKAADADSKFIETVSPRLANNRRLKSENFILPLIEENGREHTFEYISDNENRMYTLNFKLQK